MGRSRLFRVGYLLEVRVNLCALSCGSTWPPIIQFNVWRRRRDVIVQIKDNGAGITPEAVAGILDLNVRHSDKAAYRSPTRGQQGNATKTILGIPYALGSRLPLVIEARGKRHVIRPHIDPGGNVLVDHDTQDVDDQGGTRVVLSLPADSCSVFHPKRWARAFALFNPHAFVHFADRPVARMHATEGSAENLEMYKMYKRSYRATVEYPGEDWQKFGPRDLIPVNWYDLDSFTRLVFAHVQKARQGDRDWTLREFIAQFPKFKRPPVVKAITDQFPSIDRLGDFEKHPKQLRRLLELMQKESRAPQPEKLGCVGEEHFRLRFECWFGVHRFWYKKVACLVDGVPYLFEVAIANTVRQGMLFHGVNFSPTFEDFLGGTRVATDKINGMGIRGFLATTHVFKSWSYDPLPVPAAAAVHLITPVTQPLNKGKSKLVVPAVVIDHIARAVGLAAKELYQEAERREKDALAQERREKQRERMEQKNSRDIALTRVIDKVIPPALDHATGGKYRVSTHTLFYSARPEAQKHTDRVLTSSNFDVIGAEMSALRR
jgi:DNA topoisomerase VI subunit B